MTDKLWSVGYDARIDGLDRPINPDAAKGWDFKDGYEARIALWEGFQGHWGDAPLEIDPPADSTPSFQEGWKEGESEVSDRWQGCYYLEKHRDD